MMRALLWTVVVTSACGGGGGVDKPTIGATVRLKDLTDVQAGEVCDYVSDVQGGYGYSKMCGDGITLSVKKDRATCVMSFKALSTSCTATVGDAEACAEAVQDDLCLLLSAPACQWAIACAGN